MRSATPMLLSALLCTVASSSFAALPENFDYNMLTKSIRKQSEQQSNHAHSPIQRDLPDFNGYPSHFDQQLGTATFLWPTNGSATRFTDNKTEIKSKELFKKTAKTTIKEQASTLGINIDSASNAKLFELHDTGKGPVIARFQQMHNGLEVFGRQLNLLMDRQANTKAISGYFAKTPVSAAGPNSVTEFELKELDAFAKAFRDLTGTELKQQLTPLPDQHGYKRFAPVSGDYNWAIFGEPRIKALYFAVHETNQLIPAYQIDLMTYNAADKDERIFGYIVAADTGKVLVRKNMVNEVATSYRVWADEHGVPLDSPLGNEVLPAVSRDPAQAPARTAAPTRLVTLDHGPISTNDPWLDEGATETKGNNVEAFLDLAGYDGYDPILGDLRPKVTTAGVFDYDIIADADPHTAAAKNGAAVNLFYVINWLHDDWYDNGFNEAAGNAQFNNYDRGGFDLDPIWAHGQDSSGRNNANMATPPDGIRPRMQMYLWDGELEGAVEVLSPADLGSFSFGPAHFGPASFDLEAAVALADDGTDTASDACQPLQNTAEVAGKIVLADRGSCDFVVKSMNVQQAGGLAMLIADNITQEAAPTMGGNNLKITIPNMSMTLADANIVKDAMQSGEVQLRMHRVGHDIDGTIDTGIVTHEFFHYVSNRLVANSYGLLTKQSGAMGEGWSDFAALLASVREEDKLVAGNDRYQGPYGLGQYALNDNYFGIRRAPYSTDLAVYPMTFRHMQDGIALPDSAPLAYGQDGQYNSEVHYSGEIWANILWEFYASLLNDPRYNFEQAREKMQSYLIASLKLTPVYPTFIEARNAILAVVAATDEADFKLAAEAFAKRGMGVLAQGPDRYSSNNAGIVESYVGVAAAYRVESSSVDFNYDDGTQGFCSKDGILDAGETAGLKVKLATFGTQRLDQPLKATLSSNADISFKDNGSVSFAVPGIDSNYETTLNTSFKLNSAAVSEKVDLTLTFEPITDSAVNVVQHEPLTWSYFVNFDVAPTRASDDMEDKAASTIDWAASASSQSGVTPWSLTEDDTGNSLWFVAGTSASTKMTLTSPELKVSEDEDLVIGFDHWYDFEYIPQYEGDTTGYDGGILEISIDGGAFVNVIWAGGTFEAGGYNGNIQALGGDPGFIGRTNPDQQLQQTILNFGKTHAGKTIRFRFAQVSDSSGAKTGWMVDNFTPSGVTNLPFSTATTNATGCDPRALFVDAGQDQKVKEHNGDKTPTKVQLTGQLKHQEGQQGFSSNWVQITGPEVALTAATSLTTEFDAPNVTADTLLQFRLEASGKGVKAEDIVNVTIEAVAEPVAPAPEPEPAPEQKSSGAIQLFSVFSTLALLLVRRSRFAVSTAKTTKNSEVAK